MHIGLQIKILFSTLSFRIDSSADLGVCLDLTDLFFAPLTLKECAVLVFHKGLARARYLI